VRHPRKVTWLIHQHREAYDLFGSAFCSLTQSEEDRKIREAIHGLDTATLAESRSIYTISHNVTNRLKKYNGLSGVTLYPPPQYVGRYRFDEYGDFLFFAGRLDRLKRLDLVIDALVHTRSAIRLLIAGVGPVENELRAQIERLGLQARVQLLGFVGEEDLLTLYASCRAAIYLPMNEDYGYVTVEAFFSRKPVVTTMDAGGPLEFVTDGQTGFVAEAEPRALAGAVERLWDTSHARLHEMGAAGFEIVKDIGWDRVIDCLTEGC
jgi:glycosyltransferase involved in cell wall biosynthesis